jgi:hypothetical protein
MKQLHHIRSTDAIHVMARLADQFEASVDSDFDDGREELERQFAGIRLVQSRDLN